MDLYAALGVQPSASAAEIASAFRRAMKECHPDLFPGDAAKERRAKLLSQAKSTLLDPTLRARYDAKRAAPPPSAPPPRATAPPPARAPRPRPQKIAVEFLGQRRVVTKDWKRAVAQIHREVIRGLNPGKRLPVMKMVECTPSSPGEVIVRFAYRKRRQQVLMKPHVVRLVWAA
jgi:curved DNA-binding protein CbpA